MFDFLQKGGPLMGLLVFLSMVSATVFLERALYYYRVTIRAGEFLGGLSHLLARGNYAEALSECAATPGPVARVVHAAIMRHDAPRSELREIVREAGQLEVPRLERRLAALTVISYLAPMIGLLGTVLGLMDAFDALTGDAGSVATAAGVAAGVYKSLLTTAAGLAVAIPTALAYACLSSRVNTLIHDMERAGIEAVNLITQPK